MNILSKFCQKINFYFENNSRNVSFLWGYCLLILIACLDYQMQTEISLAVLYLFPVSLITWFVSKEAGVIASGLSGLAGFITKFHEPIESSIVVSFWNATVMLMVFLTVSYLLFNLRETLKQGQNLAGIDYATGVANKRLFFELAGMEVKKVHRYRHPLTIIDLDIDNFKTFNQNRGRAVGDQLLYTAAKTLKNNIRETDIVGKIGEDEFVILLPGIGYEPGHIVIDRVQSQLLEVMTCNQWSITFSIAAITFINPPESLDEMLQQADHLMYLVKNSGENQLKHKTANSREF